MSGLREVLDDALDDLPRYMAVTQPARGWMLGEGDGPTMIACVSIDDVREMLRRQVRSDEEAERLRRLLADVEPFIGWLAQVPDLKARVADALNQSEAS
jgi:hypothetical protein